MAPLLTAFFVTFTVFWVSGRVGALWLRRRFAIPEYLLLVVGTCVSALFGYVAFWTYLLSTRAGYAISLAIVVFTILGAIRFAKSLDSSSDFVKQLWPSSALCTLLTGLLYLSLFGLHGLLRPLGFMAETTFVDTGRPNDNVLPLNFATAILAHSPTLKEPSAAGWYVTDRPPLQTALTLAYRPWLQQIKWEDYYEAAGTVFQTTFVLALTSLCAVLGFSRSKACFVMLMCIFSGFTFYNCVYVWPKMLAGTFGIFAALPFVSAYIERRLITRLEVVVGAVAATLALLSHAGVVFSFIPLAGMVLLWSRRYYGWKHLMVGAIVAVVIYAPWAAYVSFVVPNQGRLLKFHLAGVNRLTNDPFPKLLLQSYRRLGGHVWLRARVVNLKLIANGAEDGVTGEIVRGIWAGRPGSEHLHGTPTLLVNPNLMHYDVRSLANMVRVEQTQITLRAFDFLNVAWILLFVEFCRNKGGWRHKRRGLLFLFLLNVLTVLAWVVLEFGGGWTYITTASFTMMLIFFVLCSDVLYDAPAGIRITIAILHLLLALFAWAIYMPSVLVAQQLHYVPRIHLSAAMLAIASAGGIVALLCRNDPFRVPEDRRANAVL